jgi:cysteinyl-tRNA synthetase
MVKIYNSLTKQKEVFTPIKSGVVSMYVCGITVYDYCHLGHARMMTAFDVIIRYLTFRGYEVNYVRNITDIDDKIINRANENNEDYKALTARFIQAMHEDMSALNLMPPTHEPCATQYIPEMISLIEKLITNGYAYVAANGDVYYEVRKFKTYGQLAHRDIDKLASGSRVEISTQKRDPLDFVLWKIAKPGEPSWQSPWGEGRPGWHIECSAMSMSLLGEHFDLHGGGKDLIFPHHENELAQSEGACQHRFVNTWMHSGYLQIDQTKMSKSLGNFLKIRDLLAQYPAEVVRYFLILSHYRSPLEYSENSLEQAHSAVKRLYTALKDLPNAERIMASDFETRFIAAMDDDFNTPNAFAILFELAHEVQRLRENDLAKAAGLGALLKYLGGVVGLLQLSPTEFLQGLTVNQDVEKIAELMAARQQARADKNWLEADRIRDELALLNIALEDGTKGSSWKASK